MNRPDKVGEPSMEEILASIRQIIADEPSKDRPEPAIEANPLVPQSHTAKAHDAPVKPAGGPVPLADRLSGVLKNGALPPTSPLGSKRPFSFDQDLADIFDEQDDGSAVAAPKPEIRVPAGLSHPMAAKSFVAPEPEKDEKAKPAALDGAAALPPQPAPSEPLVPPPPFGAAGPAPDAPLPPKTFGFPPLRKTSFYPPQPKSPVTPTVRADAMSARMSAAAAEPMVAPAESTEPVTPASIDEALKQIEGFGSVNPGSVTGVTAPTPIDAPFPPTTASPPDDALHTDFAFGSSSAYAQAQAPMPSAFVPSPSAQPSPAAAAAGSLYGAPGSSLPFSTPASAFGAVGERPLDPMPPHVNTRPMEPPRPYADSYGVHARPAPDFAQAQPYRSEPGMSSAAAHQALDALAQGLAASAAAQDSVSPAIALTPIIDVPEPDLRGPSPVSSTLPAPIPSPGTMPVNRTLEDAVADMLRPMLQQWVADNMPRIIERALRTEVAKSVKPGHKPPGT